MSPRVKFVRPLKVLHSDCKRLKPLSLAGLCVTSVFIYLIVLLSCLSREDEKNIINILSIVVLELSSPEELMLPR